MHGRLKVKTTAEQAAEKQKEREEKKKIYLAGLTEAFSKRSSATHDEEGLKITSQLLTANPDASTLWNFRRETVLAMKGEDQDCWEKLLKGEMTLIENCLLKNPKSYGAWHHRCWVMKNFPEAPWETELRLCDAYLKLDERNFHCWDYRRFVVSGSHRMPKEELETSKQLIEKNLSNYSAWHYRSKLLPIVYPPAPSAPHPVQENILIKELQTVVEAVFTDPSDQSPWFFLRWLLNRQENVPRLLQCGGFKESKESFSLILVFSHPVTSQELPLILLDGYDLEMLDWWSPKKEMYSYVWVAKVPFVGDKTHEITVEMASSVRKTLSLTADCSEHVEWMAETNQPLAELSDLTRSTLEEIRDNCVTLDELDPNNKWVLLTLVDVLWALDIEKYQEKIESYLSQLQDIDSLRTKYYADMRSKLMMENTLKQHSGKSEINSKFSLSNCSLTRITMSHLLAFTVCVDLSHNKLTGISPLKYLIICRELLLDDNNICDISPLLELPNILKLSISANNVDSLEQIRALKKVGTLKELNIRSNPVCKVEDFEEEIKCLSSIQSLIL